MNLKLTRHFQDMIQHRGIELDDVKRALSSSDETVDAHDGALKVTKQIGDKKIEVIYCRETFKDRKDEYLIITAYYL
ncbi:MAG: DUF4258 domain-containing protein [bacterium]|nr:DUF4258 domain-containing protein [bacterium]